jgi:hypothetical protein
MKPHRRGLLYLRKLRPSDRADSLREAVRLIYFGTHGGGYVIAQRGFRSRVVAVARTKRELLGLLVGPRIRSLSRGGNWKRPTTRDFRAWAKRVQRDHWWTT